MTVLEVEAGTAGVLCRLSVRWPEGHHRHRQRRLYQVYLCRDGLICEIRAFSDRRSAAAAAGIA